ncbi:MAG: hypothetical protein D9V47_03670 [Clostridia bacterium]|nr:MAG: hypothetical protein D9V47_03670 [Clostridia bacterium]
MQRPRILVIDVDTDFVEMVKMTFEPYFEVVSALNRNEGMEQAKKKAPILIILGYLEPRGTSFQVHNELRENLTTKNTPLVVVDVCAEEYHRKGWRRYEGLQMEAEDYVSRPLEPSDLWEIVGGILRRTAKQEPADLKEVANRMEDVLKEIDRIELMLTR